jgi:hypothetical protein
VLARRPAEPTVILDDPGTPAARETLVQSGYDSGDSNGPSPPEDLDGDGFPEA